MARAMKLLAMVTLALSTMAFQGCASTGGDSERPQALTGQSPGDREQGISRDRPSGLGGKSVHQYSGR